MRRIVLRDEALRERAIDAVRELTLGKGPLMEVCIKTYTRPRTGDQNALYWASIGEMASRFNSDGSELHEALKERYCPPKPVDLPDGTQVWVRSTRLLSTQEMSDYFDRVSAWAANLGVEFGGDGGAVI